MINGPSIYKTTATALGHYFDLYVRPAKAAIMAGNLDEDFKDDQEKFVFGVKQTLDRKLRVTKGVTHERLRMIAETADFSDNEKLMILYQLCKQLK